MHFTGNARAVFKETILYVSFRVVISIVELLEGLCCCRENACDCLLNLQELDKNNNGNISIEEFKAFRLLKASEDGWDAF